MGSPRANQVSSSELRVSSRSETRNPKPETRNTTPIVCDLVLLSWNHLEETKPCLESLFQSTRLAPSRLIVVDNGSEPPVREFLKTIKPGGSVREVQVIQHETNEGFPRGMNRGIAASRAPYVCLLNNDLLFTPGWLAKMIQVADAHPDIGVLNPVSSTFGNHPPRGISLEAYAESLEAQRGLYVEVGTCIGFCMLIKRQVIERIGLLTEEVERIFFEDEDYCMRAQASGFRSVVVSGAYVYHAEHRTVKRMGEREQLFQRNRQWCERKWGPWLRIACPRFTAVEPGTPELRAWLEELVNLARKRTYVHVYCPAVANLTKNELFRSVGLVPHADVLWHPLPARWPAAAAVGAILKRQKKRFDAIIAPDEPWAALMRRLRWAHQANVILASSTDEVNSLWQKRVPSLS